MQARFNGLSQLFSGSSSGQKKQFRRITATTKILRNNEKVIDSIWQSAGIAERPFQKFYRHPISRAAALAQSCPATESGHHAWPGGMISHVLESSAYALRLRKGVNLPANGTPEERKKKADLYTYTVFATTLLRELGAALDAQQIELYDRSRRHLCEWNPILEDIGQHPRARYIKVVFHQGSTMMHRPKASLLFANRILWRDGIHWIQGDPEVYAEFLDSFSNIPSGPVYQLALEGARASMTRGMDTVKPAGIGSVDIQDRRSKSPNVQSPKSTNPGSAERSESAPVSPVVHEIHTESGTEVSAPANSEAGRKDPSQPVAGKKDPGDTPGEGFRTWLEKGINESTLSMNEDQAMVHITERGLFLVVPTIFEKYAMEHSVDRIAAESNFAAEGIHLKNPDLENPDRWEARVRRGRKFSVLKGWLVPADKLDLKIQLTPAEGFVLVKSQQDP